MEEKSEFLLSGQTIRRNGAWRRREGKKAQMKEEIVSRNKVGTTMYSAKLVFTGGDWESMRRDTF